MFVLFSRETFGRQTKGLSALELLICITILAATGCLFTVYTSQQATAQSVYGLEVLIEQARLLSVSRQQVVHLKPTLGQNTWFPEVGVYLNPALPPVQTLTLDKNTELFYRGFPNSNEIVFYPDGLARGNGTFECARRDGQGKIYRISVNHAGNTRLSGL